MNFGKLNSPNSNANFSYNIIAAPTEKLHHLVFIMVSLFLILQSHSVISIAIKHYSKPSTDIFIDSTCWLHVLAQFNPQILLNTSTCDTVTIVMEPNLESLNWYQKKKKSDAIFLRRCLLLELIPMNLRILGLEEVVFQRCSFTASKVLQSQH